MATKLILVPEDMYNSLTTVNNGDDENINLNFIKEKLDSNKRKKTNFSAKNIIYNQELNRFLKMRKEIKNKPVKVELSNGAKFIIPKNESPQMVLPEVEKQEFEQIEESPINKTISWDYNTYNDITPRISSKTLKKNDETNPKSTPKTPINTPFKTRTPNTPIEQKRKEIQNIVFNYIHQTPEEFNINPFGKGLLDNKNNLIKQSDVNKSLNRILFRSPRAYSPPGTSLLRSKLLKNPTTKSIIEREQRGGEFKPKKW